MLKGITAFMSQEEFAFVRGILHPDRHQDDKEKYTRAFEIFSRLGKMVNPYIPKAVMQKRGWDKNPAH
jgi:hypothetical protein